MKNYLLLITFACSCLSIKAQEPSRLRIGFESGISAVMGEIDDRWEFRKTWTRYPDYGYYGNEKATAEGEIYFVGLKSEISVLKERMTISSGLRYSHINERISSYNNSQLYLFHPSQQGIELFRIYDMKESLGYLTVPLEADVALFGKIRRWQIFVKGGIQAGVKVHGNTRIGFVSRDMEKYEPEILATAGEGPSDFFSSVYGSAGFRFIFNSQLRITLEHNLPHLFLTKNNFSLFTPQAMPGLQFTIMAPVNIFSTH